MGIVPIPAYSGTDTLRKGDLGLESQRSQLRDIGTATVGFPAGCFRRHDLGFPPETSDDLRRDLCDSQFLRIADVVSAEMLTLVQYNFQSVNEVLDMAESARLRAIA